MGEKQIVKRIATCNSCEHFKEARLGNWVGYTPVCTQVLTQIGINEYKEGSEKTCTWLFNCTEALFCPNYKKADDDYVSRVRKGMKLCHTDSADKPYNQIYTDRQYYKTESGRKVLENLGVKKTKEKRCKPLTSTKLSYEQMKCEIENLKEENKRLKLKLEALEGQTPWKDIKDKSEIIGKLTKVKDIIDELLMNRYDESTRKH